MSDVDRRVEDTDDEPTISVHELRWWFAKYCLAHQGTHRERIADEIASFIDERRASQEPEPGVG